MKFSSLVLLHAAAAALVNARAVPPTHVKHERRNVDHPLWEKRDRVHGERILPVRIGLHQPNLDNGYDLLMEVSHPESPKYGKHYSDEEVIELFAPAAESIEAVRSWIESQIGHDHIGLSYNKQWLQFDVPAVALEEMLHTEYHEYEHGINGKLSIGCDEYHLPAEISRHVDYITPGAKFIGTKKDGLKKRNEKRQEEQRQQHAYRPVETRPLDNSHSQLNSSGTPNCDFAITPSCIKKLYGITDTLKPQASNGIALYETEFQFLSPIDLNDFLETFLPDVPKGTYPDVALIDGAPNPKTANFTEFGRSTEAAIDIQVAYGLVYPERIVNYQVDDLYYEEHDGFEVGKNNGLFNTLLDALDGSYCTYGAYGIDGDTPGIDPVYPDPHHSKNAYKGQLQCGQITPENVISISYGLDEASYPVNYQKRQCNEFMKLGLKGVTVVAASGDSGVYPGFSRCLGPGHHAFGPSSPNVCPYVLAVGATYLPPGATAGVDPEHATTFFPSGGGFSNIFPRPSYQESAVSSYFANYPPPYNYYNQTNNQNTTFPGRYNRAGRGYPDVSSNGQGLAIFNYGAVQAYGTSCSAPIWGGILARINSARIGKGKSPVGFVHPTLYANPDAFTDITIGSNPGCQTPGFKAVPGWDPVGGLGTPKYAALKKVFLALP